MKKVLAILTIILLGGPILAGCTKKAINTNINVRNNATSDLGITMDYPGGWSVASQSNTRLELRNNVNSDQVIYIEKTSDAKDKKDIWQWYKNSEFPTPATEQEKITVDGLPALKDKKTNVVIIPKDDVYYMVQDCLSLDCVAVDKDIFSALVNSIRFSK